MTISLNVLKDLGIGLYSNVPAVLAEMVANAWDAEAGSVQIEIDPKAGTVVVFDDGVGMNLEDINSRFLRVGYDKRREFGDETANAHRKVMGRKGIGKLSCFSIAETVDVLTAKGGEQHALRMSRDAIRRAVQRENPADSGEYVPQDIRGETQITFAHGTRLILRGFDGRLNWTETYLRRRLARRFSIIGATHGFQVSINSKRIAPTDREFYPRVQFIWYSGEEGRKAARQCANLENEDKGSWSIPRLEGDEPGEPYVVSGWIGTVRKPDDVGDENNTITVFAKGKVVQEDLLKDIKEARVFAEYLVGELHAEFLDDSARGDIVTSDRQRLKETDTRYEALRAFVRQLVKSIGNQWDELRVAGSEKSALQLPAVKEWYQRLRDVQRGAAKRMFGRIESLKLPDEDSRKELYRASILAFERLEYRELLDGVRSVESSEEDDRLVRLFERIDALEKAHYYQIVSGRLAALKKIQQLGVESPRWRELTISKFLGPHPWMLDPAWERASEDPAVQEKLDRLRPAADRRHRLVYFRSGGVHLLVDMRTGSDPYDASELERESALTVAVARNAIDGRHEGEDDPEPVHLVVLVPEQPRGRRRPRGSLANAGPASMAQYVTYGEMLARTVAAYAAFLERQPRESEIVDMMERLERDLNAHRPHIPPRHS